MAFQVTGLTLMEGGPLVGLDAFNSRPLVPSEAWTTSGGTEYTWTDIWFTNHILQAVLAAIIVIAFWLYVTRKPQVVPSKSQFSGEFLYNVVRNGIAREMIGPDFIKYVPWLLTLFSFIIVNNYFGEFFIFMFPTFGKVGFVWVLALLSWLLYNVVGIRKHGFLGYLKKQTIPPGVPAPLLILILPLEFLTNIVIRPITLTLRLFVNLFAGHMLILVFVLGGEQLLRYSGNILFNGAGVLAWIVSLAIFALELLIAFLQAYVFTILTTQYVSTAVAEEH